MKFARREDVSSVFDFSKKGRRITEAPPDMVFEVDNTSFMVVVGGVSVRPRINSVYYQNPFPIHSASVRKLVSRLDAALPTGNIR